MGIQISSSQEECLQWTMSRRHCTFQMSMPRGFLTLIHQSIHEILPAISLLFSSFCTMPGIHAQGEYGGVYRFTQQTSLLFIIQKAGTMTNLSLSKRPWVWSIQQKLLRASIASTKRHVLLTLQMHVLRSGYIRSLPQKF